MPKYNDFDLDIQVKLSTSYSRGTGHEPAKSIECNSSYCPLSTNDPCIRPSDVDL